MTRAKVITGALSLGVSRIATNLASLAALIVLARLLTPNDFGLVAICTTALGIVTAITELSLGSALIQREDVTREHLDSAWSLAVVRSLLIALGFALAALPLSWLYGDARLTPLFIVSGITGALSGLNNPSIALRAKAMSFGPTIALQIAQKLSGLVISVGLALWMGNYWAIILGSAIGMSLSVLSGYLIVPYRPRFNLSRSRDLLGFSSWLFASQLTNVLNWRFDHLIIGLFLPSSHLGAYTMADNIAAIPSRESTTPLVQALFPSFARLQADAPRLQAAYVRAQATIALAALPMGIGLALLAEPLVEVALGSRWAMAIPLIQVISCGYAIQTLVTASRPLAMALGDTRSLFVRDAAGLALRVPFVVIGLLGWGIMGLVLGRLLSSMVGLFITFTMVKNMLKLSIWEQLWGHRRTILAVAVMAIVVVGGDQHLMGQSASAIVRIALLVPAGAVAFLAALSLFWALEGRSPGAETELFNLARGALARR
jgi:O-antigen/teichoic acid export membrane protein